MKKLRMTTLLLLITLPTCWINTNKLVASVYRNFSKAAIEEVPLILENHASLDDYELIDLGKGWILINSKFFGDIDSQITNCDEYTKITDPLIHNPNHISWYQEKSVVLFGVPIVFSIGMILGLLAK